MECMEWLSSRYKLLKVCNEILKCLVYVLLVYICCLIILCILLDLEVV